ncbi:ComEC/Rec2 family competence protein, partial [Candidatus Peregrinibacteria bacterium]|nr:ComEC/Rec2 family competence protein [Candidatus Peregrinibacteria bacterium]
RVLGTVNRYPEFAYGERIRLWGAVQEPIEFEDFSYKNYLRRYGINSVMYYPYVEVVEAPCIDDWKYWVFGLKKVFETRLNQLFTEPHASFAAGLLLGSRRGIPEDLMEDFNISGLTHIIAISGYNITLIIVFVSGLLKFLSKRWQTIMASLVIFVFVVLVGGTAAVVRSAIMGVLGLWAVWFGRKAEVTRLLALTAALMTMWNPFILVDDVGFQLSFAATCGLVYMTDSVERFLKKIRTWKFIPEIFSIREAFVTTLAAQTFAVPIIIGAFGRFSLVAPFANVVAVSFIPLAMLFSFGAVLISCFWFYGGLLVAYVGWFFLELIMQIAYFSARVPFSSIEF